jgi:hypothetical protein
MNSEGAKNAKYRNQLNCYGPLPWPIMYPGNPPEETVWIQWLWLLLRMDETFGTS